jgi:hypothetical protein
LCCCCCRWPQLELLPTLILGLQIPAFPIKEWMLLEVEKEEEDEFQEAETLVRDCD